VEYFANNAQTTLNANITSGQTTLAVTSASGFPAQGNFRILIDSELMIVTGVSGTTFTVTRGAEGTTAASHISTALVTQILTAGAAQAFRTPTFSSLTDPSLSSFSWANQPSGATVVNTYGGYYLSTPAVGGSDALAIYETALSGSSATFFMAVNGGGGASTNNWSAGVSIRAPSSGSQVATFAMGGGSGNANKAWYFEWTNPTTFSSNPISTSFSNIMVPIVGSYVWVRRLVISTNQYWQVSGDGITFATVFSLAQAAGLGANPTTIGIYADGNTSTPDNTSVHLLSFTQP
jgi:hypothetical protein